MNILVNLPNNLGDVVASSSFIRLLHSEYPDARIDIIVCSRLSSIVKFIPFVFHTFKYSEREYNGCLGAIRFGKKISKHEKYDFSFNLENSFKSCLMVYSAGSKTRIGFKCFYGFFLLTHMLKRTSSTFVQDKYHDLIVYFTGKTVKPELPVLKVPDVFAKPILGELVYVTLYFGDEQQKNNISTGLIIELTNYILHKYPMFSVVVCSHDNNGAFEAVKQNTISPERLKLFRINKNLTDLIRTIYYSSLIVGPESDILKIAGALNIKMIVLSQQDMVPDTPDENELKLILDCKTELDVIVSAMHVFLEEV